MIEILQRIGLVRVRDGKTKWPIDFGTRGWWAYQWHERNWFGLFRNCPGVIKWEKGRLLPRRWGFYILGLEIGDRG